MTAPTFTMTLDSDDVETASLSIFRLRARERMNELYSVELEIACVGDDPPTIDDLDGVTLQVTISRADGVVRHLSGLVVEIEERKAKAADKLGYRLVLAPQLWRTTLVHNLDLHVNRTISQVIEAKLTEDHQLARGTQYVLPEIGPYAEREMMVQYRETDLAFLSRWCEHLGIFFFFEHAADGEVLRFGDTLGHYLPLPRSSREQEDDDANKSEPAEMVYGTEAAVHGIHELMAFRRAVPKLYGSYDYYDQRPTDVTASSTLSEGLEGGFVEFGDHVTNDDEALQIAQVRAGASEVTRAYLTGMSDDPRFAPGHVIAIKDHPRHKDEWVIIEVEHVARQSVSGWGEDDGEHYGNTFTLIEATKVFRPQRRTPIPRVHGFVSGIIETTTGQVGRDAQLDADGRYLVRFCFDTAEPDARLPSCRVRLMQASAGPSYGIHFPLKPGIEVAVAFLDGNPDRPVIAGAMHNPITPSPVVAANNTMSRIRTRSGILVEFEDSQREP